MWEEDAACKGMDTQVFFEQENRAVAICMGCPVIFECAQFAVDNSMAYGVWGGLTEQQRRYTSRCSMGHPFTRENTYIWEGQTFCRQCRRDSKRRSRA